MLLAVRYRTPRDEVRVKTKFAGAARASTKPTGVELKLAIANKMVKELTPRLLEDAV